MKEPDWNVHISVQLLCLIQKLRPVVKICLTVSVGTASVERSFSQMKRLKTGLQKRFHNINFSYLMKIAIDELQRIVDI